MSNIHIYKAEAEVEGLADKIKTNSSIAYSVPVVPMSDDELRKFSTEIARQKVAASLGLLQNEPDKGLFPVKSVLVSTNWNKNDDVFGKEETWAARRTPANKPTNIEHDEEQIVGHIRDTWAVNNDGEMINDDVVIDDLPDSFHICTASVVYKNWDSTENQVRADNLIQEIQSGEKFVSMECLFSGFDYAVVDPEGKFFVVGRNEESAFLTKHLRAYGGTGEFNNHKVGRFLKQIEFSGKGYVNKPANPNSVIFADEPRFDFSSAACKNPFIEDGGVYFNKQPSAAVALNTEENSNMSSELEIVQPQHKEEVVLAKEVTQVETEAAIEPKAQVKAEEATPEREAQIQEEESTVKATEEVEKDKALLEATEAKVEELTKKLDEITKEKNALETTLVAVEADRIQVARISTLVDGGIDKKDAEAKVTLFENLTDEQFTVIAAELIEVNNIKTSQADESAEDNKSEISESSTIESDVEQDAAEANADEEVLETAETEKAEVAGAASDEASEEDDVQATRISLATMMASEYLNVGKVESDDESDVN